MEGYDIIGDIHGQADVLEALLRLLGYRLRLGGIYQHPSRTAVFVGDYIDRNPNSRRVLDIVKRMVDEKAAIALMGNHEFNAVAFHTPDPKRPGQYLRTHSEKHVKQHDKFLCEMHGDPEAHDEAISWFRGLPMWCDLGGIRVVHAAWLPGQMKILSEATGGTGYLTDLLLEEGNRKGTPQFRAIETVLKGIELPLRPGEWLEDSYGTRRHESRVKWWLSPQPAPLREMALAGPEVIEQLPDRLEQGPFPADMGYAETEPPVFIGHYWLRGDPEPLAPNIVCVDYSAALATEKLVAYRWSGESRLTKANFVSIPVEACSARRAYVM